MNSPKISVVIPSFNKVKYIEKTLDSIVSQKYSNLEVIIQDGGSTDGTLEILKKYEKKFPNLFRLESKKDNGQLDAINKGMAKAIGDIFTYINADDIYEKSAFTAIARAYEDNPEALWFAGRGSVIDFKGHEIAKPVTWYKSLLLTFNFYPLLLVTNYLMQPSVFLTKSAWQKYGSFSGTSDFVTEYDLWLKISKHQMPVILNRNLSYFRIESGTKTKQMSKKLLKEDEEIVRKYSNNSLILVLHKLHNYGRNIIGRIV